ncbi:MAG: hypothetical protein QOC78_2655 [Solirubrobacteraceae bacterium]|nr:hypothetical protein [Solirubrobacteraceae bacterium]MEA2277695.1 hypothetical protein [Solirubrobacteraceae bacterium]
MPCAPRYPFAAPRTRRSARANARMGRDERGNEHGMPTDPEPLTLSEAVHRAVVVVDPEDQAGLEDLLARFEDDDEPLGGGRADVIAQRIAEVLGELDPQAEDPAVQMAGAVATYLAFRRDEVDEEPRALLELAARAEFEGNPPAGVRELLAERGVEL